MRISFVSRRSFGLAPTIVDRYLFREVFVTFAAVFSVVMLIYVSHRFVRYLASAAAGSMSSDLIMELLALKLVENLSLYMPFALFIGILLALGRMYQDSEIVAMTAGGVGTAQIARAVLFIAVGFGAVLLVLSLYLSPEVAAVQEVVKRKARSHTEVSGIFPGRFQEFGRGDQVVYVEAMAPDRQKMNNVFVQVRRANSEDLVVAQSAYQVVQGEHNSRYIVLENGFRYEGGAGDLDFVITEFEKHAVLINVGETRKRHLERETWPTIDLIGSDTPKHVAELQWRLSKPISAIILALLAVPLSPTSHRGGRFARLLPAVLAYFVYNNLLGIAQKLIETQYVPAWVGVWPVHILFAAIASLLLFLETERGWNARRRLRQFFSRAAETE